MESINSTEETTNPKKLDFIVNFKRYALFTGILTVLNIVLYNLATNYAGYLDSATNLKSSLSTMLIVLPLLSFILALFFAFIPYKGKPYKQKYVPMVFLLSFIINCMILIALIFGVAKFFL